jgi:RNA polymerase sporulation-specific sigma factor
MNNDEWFMDGHKLPQPLPRDETYKLIQLVANGSEEARVKLVTHNIRLVLYIVSNRFSNVEYDKKDLVSIGNIGLLKAIDTFDISKGFEFSTYAVRCIVNEILLFLKKINNNTDSIDRIVFHDKDGSKIKLEDKLSDGSDLVEDHEQNEIHSIIRKLVQELPNREKEVVMLYFGFYNNRIYTQEEIAGKLNISQSYTSRLIKKIVKKIGKQLDDVGVLELHEKGKKETKKSQEKRKRKIPVLHQKL